MAELSTLRKQLQDERVLSVYLSVEERDPARRGEWRVRLDHLLDAARAEVAPEELTSFAGARARVEEAMSEHTGLLPRPGFAVFATGGRVWHAGPVPAPVSDRAAWGQGPGLAAYVRALKHTRPVCVALIDSRRARLFRYVYDQLTEVVDLRAATAMGDLSDVNISKRASTRSGVRGATATDVARRSLEVEMDRLVDEAAAVVAELAGGDGAVLVGGPEEAAAAAEDGLAAHFGNRMQRVHGLHLEMTEAEVRDAADRGASELSRRLHLELVDRVTEAAAAGGRACVGSEAARHALAAGQVDTLLLSAGFVAGRAAEADTMVGLAFDAGADVEVVVGGPADRLDRNAGGVAARLRYRVRPARAALDGSTAPEPE